MHSTFKVKNNFSLKCRTPRSLMANVVYKFNSSRDANISYIGKTKRHLATIVREHSNSASAICDHLGGCTTCKLSYSIDNGFKILDVGKNDFEITVKEALRIKHFKPSLNKKLTIQGTSNYVLKIF